MPASPEQATANTAVGQAYADAAPTADAQKSALLTAIAQAGQAGALAAKQQTDTANRGTQQALGQVNQMQGFGAGGAEGVAQLQSQAAAPTQQLAQIAGENQMMQANWNAGLGETNRSYMDALKSAIPLQQEWTQRQANAIAARAQQEREVREAQLRREREEAARSQRAEAEKVEVKLPDGRTIRVSPEAALGHYSGTTDITKWESEKAERDARTLRVADLRNRGANASADVLTLIIGQNPDADLATLEGMLAATYKADKGLFATPGGKSTLNLDSLRRYLRFIYNGGSSPVGSKARSKVRNTSSRSIAPASSRSRPTPTTSGGRSGPSSRSPVSRGGSALGFLNPFG